MDIIRLCAWGYAALLGFVILTGYIPAFIDANDMIFGLFRRTWYADGLHLVSALWAAAAAITSRRASELFFQLFGVFYFADGVLGLLTGSGYLDFGILINGVLNLPLSTRFFANAPHLGLGGVAILIGYGLAPRTRTKEQQRCKPLPPRCPRTSSKFCARVSWAYSSVASWTSETIPCLSYGVRDGLAVIIRYWSS